MADPVIQKLVGERRVLGCLDTGCASPRQRLYAPASRFPSRDCLPIRRRASHRRAGAGEAVGFLNTGQANAEDAQSTRIGLYGLSLR